MLDTIAKTSAPAAGRTGRLRARRGARLFATGILFLCLFMQRFGTPMNGGAMILNIVGPLGLGLAIVAAFAGILAFDRVRLTIFLTLVAFALVGQVHAHLGIVAYNGMISLASRFQ